jgi:hypothetical protein
MFCRSAIPLGSESMVLLNSFAELIMFSKLDLSVGVATLRCPLEPLKRLLVICNSKPEMLLKGDAEPKLHIGVTDFSRAPHAPFAFNIINRVHETDGVFCGGVTLLGGLLVPVS